MSAEMALEEIRTCILGEISKVAMKLAAQRAVTNGLKVTTLKNASKQDKTTPMQMMVLLCGPYGLLLNAQCQRNSNGVS